MDPKFLFLLVLCVCAAALPRDKRSSESNNSSSSSSSSSEEFGEITTTTKPTESKLILIKDITDLETRISQAGDNLVIIFFMTTWCPFCKKINPTIEDVAAKTENLIVLKVDRDNLEENADGWKYGLSELPSVPRFIFIKNGQKVKEIHGSDADLRGTVTRVMSPSYNPDADDSSESSEE